MRYYLLLLALVLAFGCVTPEAPGNTTSVLGPGQNTTQNESIVTPPPADTTKTLPADYAASFGDNVSVYYNLWVDGELFDTNNKSLADEHGILSLSKSYRPMKFKLAFSEGLIDGFIANVLGMGINESLSFTVEPKLGYGLHDPSKVVTVDRYYNMSLYEVVPRSYFEGRDINLSNGTTFETDVGPVIVDDFNEENVTVFYLLSPGKKFNIMGMPQTVVRVQNTTATIEFALTLNRTYSLPDPYTGMSTSFKVTDKTDTNITLDSNHPLANKTLHFDVTVVDIEADPSNLP